MSMDQQDKSGARFSKGPWEVVDHPTYPSFRGVRGPSFNVSAVMQATDLTFADYLQRDADLHLIAAAPELYEGLSNRVDNAEQRAFDDWLARTTPSGDVEQVQAQWERSSAFLDFCDEWKAERAVLAKATGSQQ